MEAIFSVPVPQPKPAGPRSRKAPKPADAWREALGRLHPSDDPADRERQFERFVDEAMDALPDLVPYRDDILVYLRTVSAASSASMRIAGEPSEVVHAVDLPQMTAEDLMKEASLAGQIKARILSQEMVPASDVHKLLGLAGANPRQYANRLRARGDLVAVPDRRNRYLYPLFQFDLDARRPYPEVVEVNRLLSAVDDPWGIAGWWTQRSSMLGGKEPRELVGKGQEKRLLGAARDVIADW